VYSTFPYILPYIKKNTNLKKFIYKVLQEGIQHSLKEKNRKFEREAPACQPVQLSEHIKAYLIHWI
jgi:hypothetical protein